ncbi:MAG: MFS transporter [Verrucomicrobiales bacterium]|nr:MFS transporter [Verrucomicrobiales bacterium]
MNDANAKSIRIRLFVMMLLQIAIWGAWQPKIFAYMGMLKFEEWQIQLAGSLFGLASLVGMFFSNQLADRHFSAERFLAVSNVIGGLALVGTAYQVSFWPFFACFSLYCLVYVPTIAVGNSLAFAHLKDPANEFGFVRMGGTIGWIVVSWPFILLLRKDAGVEDTRTIFLVAAAISFALAVFSWTSLPHTPPKKDVRAEDRLAWVKAVRMLKMPFVLVLFVVTFIDSTIHNGYFVMADEFLTKRVGITSNISMVVMSIGQVAEIVAMLILGKVLAKLGWKWTMIFGVLGHASRFAVFAFFPDSQWLIITVQVLHGICYAFFFAAVYIFVDAVFPKDVRSSAQGLFNMLILGCMVVASFFFVWVKGQLTVDGATDWQQLFLVPTGMALVGMVLMAFFFRPPTRGPDYDDKLAGPAAH